jgi:5-methyltetrahydrofolate--homocysteine methyltransferase
MTPFWRALHSDDVLLMDGALGTQLQERGLNPGECAGLWNLTRPREVRAIHRAYREAGARCLLVNTFLCNPIDLARHGLADRLDDINAAGLELARQAAGRDGFVLADIGPILEPGKPEFADRRALARTVASLSGADGYLFETCSGPESLAAVEYVLHRCPQIESAPVLLSLTYLRDPSGRLVTRSGHGPETYARHAARHGVAVLGVNCGREIDLDAVLEIVRRYRGETDLPLLVRPNAGTPNQVEGRWVYPRGPAEMAARVPELLDAGVRLIGGCCGTTAAHIAAFREAIGGWRARRAARGSVDGGAGGA